MTTAVDGRVSSRELGLQGVSARPLAILPILPGSIATGSRSDTLPRQAPAGIPIRFAVRRRHSSVDIRSRDLDADRCAPARNRVPIAVWRKRAHFKVRSARRSQRTLARPRRSRPHAKRRSNPRAGIEVAHESGSQPLLVGERGSVPGAQAGGNTARQYRQYCRRLRGGHRPALDSREYIGPRSTRGAVH